MFETPIPLLDQGAYWLYDATLMWTAPDSRYRISLAGRNLSDERYEFLRKHEQFVLAVSEFGYGKRSSSYDFRLTGRGGKGIRATDVSKVAEIGRLVATFPVANEDQIMLVSDGGQVIRVPVNNIRIASRATKGVTIFSTAEGEKVVSVERISEPQGDDQGDVEEAEPAK